MFLVELFAVSENTAFLEHVLLYNKNSCKEFAGRSLTVSLAVAFVIIGGEKFLGEIRCLIPQGLG